MPEEAHVHVHVHVQTGAVYLSAVSNSAGRVRGWIMCSRSAVVSMPLMDHIRLAFEVVLSILDCLEGRK